MIQRKQTLFLLAAIVMTVICLCMQIGSFKAAGLEVASAGQASFRHMAAVCDTAAYDGDCYLHHFPLPQPQVAGTLLSV